MVVDVDVIFFFWLFWLLFFTELLTHIVICCSIKNTSNPDIVILEIVYVDQGDPIALL